MLDDELRQEVPGTAGWRWTHDDFVAETYSSPSVYLVTPGYDGHLPRLAARADTSARASSACAVRRAGAGSGGRSSAAALGETNALGFSEVTTEIDVENAASQTLFRGFGARRIGGFVELARPG